MRNNLKVLFALLVGLWCTGAFAGDLQLTRTAPPFDLPNVPGIDGRQFTFSGSLGPVVPLPAGKLAIGGHQLFYDLAVLTPPANGGTAAIEKWVEPSLGNIAAYSAAYKAQVPGAGQMIPRGVMFADGRWFGNCNLYYNVKPDLNVLTGWSSDGVSSFNGFARTNFTCLQTGGRIGPLSKPFRDAWGHDTWMFESTMQNHAATNNGPALYTFNRKPNVIPGEILQVTKRFDTPFGGKSNPVSPWDQWCEICGAACTPNHMIYTYRQPVGAKWYGVGSGIDSQTGPVASILFPGQQAKDDFDPNSKGYHAESYRHTLLVADRESVLAGAPVFKEVDVSGFFTAKCARDAIAYDESTDSLWMLEGYANGFLPRIHRFKTRTEADAIREQIAALQVQIDVLESQKSDLLKKLAGMN